MDTKQLVYFEKARPFVYKGFRLGWDLLASKGADTAFTLKMKT